MSALTDPIADLLTRVRNALHARHARVELPSSRVKIEIARVLKEEGYISNYKQATEGKKRVLRIFLRYDAGGQSAISGLERLSRPGRRVYVGAREIPKVQGGFGINILTTPRGVMTGKAARQAGVGGELLCKVY